METNDTRKLTRHERREQKQQARDKAAEIAQVLGLMDERRTGNGFTYTVPIPADVLVPPNYTGIVLVSSKELEDQHKPSTTERVFVDGKEFTVGERQLGVYTKALINDRYKDRDDLPFFEIESGTPTSRLGRAKNGTTFAETQREQWEQIDFSRRLRMNNRDIEIHVEDMQDLQIPGDYTGAMLVKSPYGSPYDGERIYGIHHYFEGEMVATEMATENEDYVQGLLLSPDVAKVIVQKGNVMDPPEIDPLTPTFRDQLTDNAVQHTVPTVHDILVPQDFSGKVLFHSTEQEEKGEPAYALWTMKQGRPHAFESRLTADAPQLEQASAVPRFDVTTGPIANGASYTLTPGHSFKEIAAKQERHLADRYPTGLDVPTPAAPVFDKPRSQETLPSTSNPVEKWVMAETTMEHDLARSQQILMKKAEPGFDAEQTQETLMKKSSIDPADKALLKKMMFGQTQKPAGPKADAAPDQQVDFT